MAEAMRVEAASLLRVSTFVQARDGTSLESQDEKNTEFIGRNGWNLYDRYVEEEGVSGRSDKRDDVARLLADVRAGRVHVVVVNKVDRLVRDERQFHNIIGEIEAAGALFVSATEGFDPATSSGRATRSILAWAASFERDRIVERTWEGTRKTAERGYWPGGAPTYGLRAVPVEGTKHKALDADEQECALLRLAAGLIADEGCTPAEAADRVNGLGHRTRTGRPWTATALRRVLSADGLCGTFTFAGPKRGRANKGGAIVIPVPAVFTPERRAEVMAALAGTYRPVAAKALYPLSGRMFALCGEKYRGSNKSALALRQYRCMGHEHKPRCGCDNLHGEQVETAVWEAVRGLLADPERLLSMVREYLERRGQQMSAERDQLAAIDAKIAAHERAVKRTLVEYALQGLPADAVRAATDELQRELGALRRHRAQVRQWQVANLSDSERMRKLWAVADLAHTRLATMTPEERARVLALLHVRVTVIGADACPDCGGSGKLPGRRGGYRCQRCRGLARIARCRVEGTLIDRFTDAVAAAGDEPTGAVRDFRNTDRDDACRRFGAQKGPSRVVHLDFRAMPEITLTADIGRPLGSRASNRLRKSGKIPGVLYGHGNEPLPIAVDGRSLRAALSGDAGLNALLNLDLDGRSQLAMAKDIQRDPVRGTVSHVDFLAVSRDEVITADVPVLLVGEAKAVESNDGVVDQQLHTLTMQAKPADLPNSIEVDISGLQIGDTIRVDDLPLPGGATTEVDGETAVVVGQPPRVAEEAVSAEGAAEAPEGAEAGAAAESGGEAAAESGGGGEEG